MSTLSFKSFLFIFAVFTLAVSLEAAFKFDFDCRRGQTGVCGTSGNCDLSTGDCDCGGGGNTSYSYECKEYTPGGTCNPSCLNGGVCDNSSTCVCTDAYYSPTCNIERVYIACEDDKMFLNVNPHGNFQGLIYVNGKADVTACQLSDGTAVPTDEYIKAASLTGYRLELNHTSPDCGDASVVIGIESTTYSRTFFIQYNNLFRSSVDQIVTAECSIATGKNVTISSNVRSVLEAEQNYNNVTVDDDVDVVSFDVMDKDMSAITEDVTLGQEIKLVFQYTPGTVPSFEDFTLTSCKANNALEDQNSDYREVEIINDGCPTSQAAALFSGAIEKENAIDNANGAVKWTVTLKAFMFAGPSSLVAFVCDLSLCDNTALGDCAQQSSCDGYTSGSQTTSSGYATATSGGNSTTTPTPSNNGADNATTTTAPAGRRKRDVQAQDTSQVSKTIKVVDPLDKFQAKDEVLETPEEKDCMDESAFVATIIVLVLMMILLIILVLILLIRVLRTRNKVSANRSERYPQPVETMRIPRLEVNTMSSQQSC